KGKYLASAGRDGHIKIWNLETNKLEKTLHNQINREINKGIKNFVDVLPYRIDWSIDGDYLLYSYHDEIVFCKRDLWKTEYTLKDKRMKLPYQTRCTKDGEFVIVVDVKKQYLIFNISEKRCKQVTEHEEYITDLQVSNDDDTFIIADISGSCSMIMNECATNIPMDI